LVYRHDANSIEKSHIMGVVDVSDESGLIIIKCVIEEEAIDEKTINQ
jgi:hypothetical protein